MSPRYSLRRYARRDSNEKPLVEAFKDHGATWLPIAVRDGPDGIVGFQGQNLLVEIKTPKGKHQDGQVVFAANWRGTVTVIRTVADVCAVLGCQISTHARAQLLACEKGQSS